MRMFASRRGVRVFFASLVKIRGDRESSKGRILYCYVRFSNVNRRNWRWRGRMEIWKYAFFRFMVVN